MKLTLNGLKEKEQWEKAGVALPAYDIAAVAEETKKSPVWVHFGAGNIFRIFIGGIAAYQFVWDLGDVGVGLMTIFNMIALFPLAPKALQALTDYEHSHKR